MKRGRPLGTPQSNKRTRGDPGRRDDAAPEKEVTDRGRNEGQTDEEHSPQKKGPNKLPPLTEEQIKARFEGMTTRHKRTPSKRLLDGADLEESKTTSSTSTPKANKPKTSTAAKVTPKASVGKLSKTVETPKSKETSESTETSRRGRGRPPKQTSTTPVREVTPASTRPRTSLKETVQFKQRESPRAPTKSTALEPTKPKAVTVPAVKGKQLVGTKQKVQAVDSTTPVAEIAEDREIVVATSIADSKVSVVPEENVPILETMQSTVAVPVELAVTEEVATVCSGVELDENQQITEHTAEPITYLQVQPITEQQAQPVTLVQQKIQNTEDQAKIFVEKFKSRLGLQPQNTVLKQPTVSPVGPLLTKVANTADIEMPETVDVVVPETTVQEVPETVEPEVSDFVDSAATAADEQTTDRNDSKANKPKDPSQAPVTVNIVLKDQSCLPYMADVGMHILYYCKHCTHYSQQLLSVIEHIKTCDKKNTEDSSAVEGKEDEVAEYLESVALNEIQEERGIKQEATQSEIAVVAPSEEENQILVAGFVPEELSETPDVQEEEDGIAEARDDDDEDWKPFPVKKIPRILMEETEEDRIQKLCDICQKPVFTFSVRRHMENHARREAEIAAKEKAKAIALGLDAVADADLADDSNSADAQKEDEPMDTETHLSVETGPIKGTVEVIETSGAAAIAVPVQPEVELGGSENQTEAEAPHREVTITIKETDADNISVTTMENGDTSNTNGATDFIVPKTIPKGLALKKTLFPCKIHELYFVSQEALTEHFISEHYGGEVEPASVLPHIRRGRGRPRGSLHRGRGGAHMKVAGRPGITPDEEAAAVAMSVMRHSKLGWSRQKVNPGRGGPVKCPICYKKFASSFRFEMHHTRAHSADKMKPVACEACGKLFRNQVQRRNHFRIVHEGKKRIQSKSGTFRRERKLFICDLCGYSTPDNSRLKNHIMSVHQGIMPYACDQCDYKCNEKSDIVRHKHKHLGIKRYSCEYCTYRADQRWLLVNHTVKQHGVQLPKNTRNTKGGYFSMRNKKRRDHLQQQINPLQWILHQNPDLQVQESKGEPDEAMTEAAHAVLELGDVATDPTGEQVTVYIEEVLEDGTTAPETVQAYAEGQEISVEELQQVVHDSKPGDVMYVREDGTVIEPEEAALLLMSVNTPGSNIQIEEVTQVPELQTTEQVHEELLVPMP